MTDSSGRQNRLLATETRVAKCMILFDSICHTCPRLIQQHPSIQCYTYHCHVLQPRQSLTLMIECEPYYYNDANGANGGMVCSGSLYFRMSAHQVHQCLSIGFSKRCKVRFGNPVQSSFFSTMSLRLFTPTSSSSPTTIENCQLSRKQTKAPFCQPEAAIGQ
jgi:hypothetical protein